MQGSSSGMAALALFKNGSTYASFLQPGFKLAILKCLVNFYKTTL